MEPRVLIDVDAGIARLTLNRPEALNALDPLMAAELATHGETLAGRDDIGAVILAAAGSAFCVGGDLAWMDEQGDGIEDALRGMATDLHRGIAALAHLEAPVVAAVQGVAAGAGMSLACAADIVLASQSSRFTMAYTAAGLSPDGGSTWYLPRIVGERRAAELMLLNPRLGADEAARLGIVTRVVADDELAVEVERVARSVADGATGAYGATKRLLRSSAGSTLEAQLDRETDEIAVLSASADGHEGRQAFFEKRTPRFGNDEGSQ